MKNLIHFDWAMKRLLRDKANYVVLEGFLSELLKYDITILQMGESESNQQEQDDKYNRVDIVAHTSSKEIILIELQVDSEVDYFQRMLYGVSKTITEHIKVGETYETVKKVYSVNIVYFGLGQGEDYVYHGKTEFRGLHTHDLLGLTANQKQRFQLDTVHQIYPEYYILKINNFNDVAKDGLDEWIYFLKNDEIKDDFKAKGLQDAKEKLVIDKMSSTEKEAYKHHLENKMYAASMLASANFEGRQEGRQEEKIEIVRNAKKMGMSVQDISKLTGLSEDFIKSIE